MLLNDFRRILTAFADSPADVDIGRGRLLVQVREEVLEGQLFHKEGLIWVREAETEYSARDWIVNRIARLPLLADRVLSYVEPEANFITPSGSVLGKLREEGASEEVLVNNAVNSVIESLSEPSIGTATVLYLTSDAGEGKTTVVHEVAREVARRYKAKTLPWLLIPISLGGRPFLRFDDIVIAALVNRLRFPLLYYEALIELVRLGAIVPAFDGFEEMFVESSTGEAVSALGDLIDRLDSAGSVLVSARKAFFEYKSFAMQAKLLDALRGDSVAFARLALDRWKRSQFVDYAIVRGVDDPDQLYEQVSARLGDDHPLLTRAVLVRRLVDVTLSAHGLQDLIDRLGASSDDYFGEFVRAIVEREAREKWIDRSGETPRSLLSIEEHEVLLAMVAQEMWINGTEILRGEIFDLIADVFSESLQLSPSFGRQVKERLKQHSLVVATAGPPKGFRFDHEDFQRFFLGVALGNAMLNRPEFDLSRILSSGLLPGPAFDAGADAVRRSSGNAQLISQRLSQLCAGEPFSSFIRENTGGAIVRLVELEGTEGGSHSNLVFPHNSLAGRTIKDVEFIDCYFHPTLLQNTELKGVQFSRCTFERLEIADHVTVVECVMQNCDIGSVVDQEREIRAFNPAVIFATLGRIGFDIVSNVSAPVEAEEAEPDEDMIIAERAFRLFLRATQINEIVFRQRLGVKANRFVDYILPRLLDAGVFAEVPYAGHGKQVRVRLAVPMRQVEAALTSSRGSFVRFMQNVGGTIDRS